MFKMIKNKKGMTIVEVVVAVAIIALMIWVFAPFVATTFKQIAQAGNLHRTLSDDMSVLDRRIADEYYGADTTFPLEITTGSFAGTEAEVGGFMLNSGNLSTFYAEVQSYVATNDIFYEGYKSDGFYDDFYSIGFLPSSWLESFFEFLANYEVTLTGNDGFEYDVDVSVTYTSGDINPSSVDYKSNVFHVPTTLPDGLGSNNNKAAYLCMTIDNEGMDNWNSPYVLEINKWYIWRWLRFTDEVLPITVRLPIYSAVGESGFERVAAESGYWVDKYSYTDPNYGDAGITVDRLPAVTFKDIIWYEDESTTGRYYAAGNGGNLWQRESEEKWTQITLTGISKNLKRIKRLGDWFVTIGKGSTVLVSDDGLSWSNKSVPSSLAPYNNIVLSSLSHNGNGRYILLSATGDLLYTDDDFDTYTAVAAVDTGLAGVADVIWTGEYFIAVGDGGLISSSTDGETWVPLDVPTLVPDVSGNLNALTLNSELGIIVGRRGQIHNFRINTPDNIDDWTWSTAVEADSSKPPLQDVVFARDAYVAVGNVGYVMYSRNGIDSWQEATYMDGYDTSIDMYAVAGLN